MTEKISLPKLIELAERAAEDLCKGRLTITRLNDGWRASFGEGAAFGFDTMGGSVTLEEALARALRRLLAVTISNLDVMLGMLEFPNHYPDLDDDAA